MPGCSPDLERDSRPERRLFLIYTPDLPPGGWGYSALLLLLQLLAAAVHWRRWLAYDKTSKIDDHNEEESPHER